MSSKIILYGHTTCPGVPPVKGVLNQINAPYEYVNIHQDTEAAVQVRDINNGYESVPTLVFPDGSTLTEPSFAELKVKLESLGYQTNLATWLRGNIWQILMVIMLVIAILRLFDVF